METNYVRTRLNSENLFDRPQIDLKTLVACSGVPNRVHFVKQIPFRYFRKIPQIGSAHLEFKVTLIMTDFKNHDQEQIFLDQTNLTIRESSSS